MIKFGITERGDIAFDENWIGEIDTSVQAAILISKGIPTRKGIEEIKKHKDKFIFHATTTGYGGTKIEPNVIPWQKRLNQLEEFIKETKLEKSHVVIRIDPIIPSPKGLKLAQKIIEKASEYGYTRFRYSFIDIYRHVKERFLKASLPCPPSIKEADKKTIQEFYEFLEKMTTKGLNFESCAENDKYQTGCISKKDFILCGLNPKEATGKSLQRHSCLCCNNKTELLQRRTRCPHQCLYCYWKD